MNLPLTDKQADSLRRGLTMICNQLDSTGNEADIKLSNELEEISELIDTIKGLKRIKSKDVDFEIQKGGMMIYDEGSENGHLVLITELEEMESEARSFINDPAYYKSELQELANSYYYEHLKDSNGAKNEVE